MQTGFDQWLHTESVPLGIFRLQEDINVIMYSSHGCSRFVSSDCKELIVN